MKGEIVNSQNGRYMGIMLDTFLTILFMISMGVLFTREWIDTWKLKSSKILDNKLFLMMMSFFNVMVAYIIMLFTLRNMGYLTTAAISIYLFFSILQATWYVTAVYYPKSLRPMPYSNVVMMAMQFALFYCIMGYIFYRWYWFSMENDTSRTSITTTTTEKKKKKTKKSKKSV